MQISETDAVVLCGGLGKRLRPVTGENPKVMAEVDGQPFLDFLVISLGKLGFKQVILLTGYKANEIEEYFRKQKNSVRLKFSREHSPLGTGGALKYAHSVIESDPFVVLNGDSFCPLDYPGFLDFHTQKKALATIVLSKVDDPRDFGTIEMDVNQKISSFKEKKSAKTVAKKDVTPVLVNAGVYAFSQKVFELMPRDEKFSLETDFFPSLVEKNIFGYPVEEKFLDIGTPERFSLAQKILKKGNGSGQE